MARGLNTITLIGSVVTKPEVKYTPSGLAILDINLAANDLITDEQGQHREVAWYHNVKLFGKIAEFWADTITAGMVICAQGKLSYSSWEKDGQRTSKLEVLADRLERVVLEGKPGQLTASDSKGQERIRDGFNQVTIIGNLTRDADMKYTPTGAAVTRLALAVNERTFARGSSEPVEKVHYVDAEMWRELAEYAGEFKKGDGVFLIGRLKTDSWTAQDGTRKYRTLVQASRLERLARGTQSSGGQGSQSGDNTTQGRASKVNIEEGLTNNFPPEEDLPF